MNKSIYINANVLNCRLAAFLQPIITLKSGQTTIQNICMYGTARFKLDAREHCTRV